MGLEEEPVDAHRGRRTNQRGNHGGVSPRRVPEPARSLHRMRAVEDHRREGTHGRQRTEVDHQVVVAERRAALHQRHRAVPRDRLHLRHRVPHVFGGHELALLDQHRLARGRRGEQQVRLPAQESGDLQHVRHLRHLGDVAGLVHIGVDRQAGLALHVGEDLQRLGPAGSAEGLHRGAVRLVVGGLEDHRDRTRGSHLAQPLRDAQHDVAPFHDARAAHQQQLPVGEQVHGRSQAAGSVFSPRIMSSTVSRSRTTPKRSPSTSTSTGRGRAL